MCTFYGLPICTPFKPRSQTNELEGMAGFSHFGSERGKTVSQPTLLIVIIVKKD